MTSIETSSPKEEVAKDPMDKEEAGISSMEVDETEEEKIETDERKLTDTNSLEVDVIEDEKKEEEEEEEAVAEEEEEEEKVKEREQEEDKTKISETDENEAKNLEDVEIKSPLQENDGTDIMEVEEDNVSVKNIELTKEEKVSTETDVGSSEALELKVDVKEDVVKKEIKDIKTEKDKKDAENISLLRAKGIKEEVDLKDLKVDSKEDIKEDSKEDIKEDIGIKNEDIKKENISKCSIGGNLKNCVKEENLKDFTKKENGTKDKKDVKMVNGIKKSETVYNFSFDAEKFIVEQISKMGLEQMSMKKLNDMNCQLKSVERKQKEINKIFSDCSDLLSQFCSSLETTTWSDGDSEKKEPENIETVEISDDDDVEFIETTFEPELINRHHRSSVPSSVTPSNMDSLRAALTEALNKQIPPQGQNNLSLNKQLSEEDRRMFDIHVGSKVLGKKSNDIWYKGIVQEISHKDKTTKLKIKFDGKGTKVLDGKHVSFFENWSNPVRVGSRVVGMSRYRDEETTNSMSFYAGIVAEVPTNRNKHRFLIFFDDGYAQYCLPKEIHRVYEQSENVWEDIHPDSQEFIKEYLAQYPERPMVQLQKNQVVKTEWNGKWWTARVMEVDASLVKMYFAADKRTEWIYRGSTRLEPLFSALARAETNKMTGFKSKRQRLVAASRGNKPVVEYTRAQQLEAEDNENKTKISMNSSAKRQSVGDSGHHPDQKKRSVAKKSTSMSSHVNNSGGNSWEAPWLKIQRNSNKSSGSMPADKKRARTRSPTMSGNRVLIREQFQASSISSNKQGRDMASVLQERLAAQTDGDLDEEALGERIDIDNIISPRNMLRKKLIPHECSSECVKETDDENYRSKFLGRNMLLVPTLLGWERQVTKVRPTGKRVVIYRGPCARRMRNLEEVDKYLMATNSALTIDLFTFDPNLHTHTEFVPIKTFCDIKDLSYGKENVPISCVNGIDRQYPDYVEYSNERLPNKGVQLNLDQDFLICCDCTDGCRDRSKCACVQMTIEATTASPGGHRDETVGYHYRRLKEPILTGIYECSSRCKCDYRCFNKVAQNGLQLRLQVFKTEKRGWGLRCLDDIPAGGFICIYAGLLLTEQGANEDGQQYGDEYLAELDYIEVVEKHKEGYESEVVDPDEDTSDDSSSSSGASLSSDSSDRDRTSKKNIDGKTEEKLGKLVLKRESNKDKEWSIKVPGTSQRTVAWVESLNNEPIIIDDDDDDDDYQVSKNSNRVELKKDNIFTILSDKKEISETNDELPEVEEIPKTIHESEPMSLDNSVDAKDEKDQQQDPHIIRRKCTRSTMSRFKNLPNPKVPMRMSDGNEKKSEGKADEKEQRPSTRYYFNDGQLCYVMDAKSTGNIGRYLNHSCSPNVFVQNVFVDTHDLRFPWVAFFAGQYIRAGTELTWDYNYEVGSVPGKVLYCYCSSAECRGRLL